MVSWMQVFGMCVMYTPEILMAVLVMAVPFVVALNPELMNRLHLERN